MKRLQSFLSRWQNLVGILTIFFIVIIALAAPLLSPPNDQTQGAFKKVGLSTDLMPHPPGENAILGTLPGQTDVFHALVWGTRDAMIFGLSVAVGSFLFGSVFGAISGYAGGALNNLMMRIVDAFLTFPVLAGVVFLQEIVATTIEALGGVFWFNNDFYGKQIYFEFTPPPLIAFLLKVDPILISLIIFSWMPIARLVNTMIITLKNTEFVQAARVLGGSPWWIIRKHLLPNSIGPVVVLAARDVGNAVILQATITFLGLGGSSSWGTMLSIGRDWIIGANGDLFSFWWTYIPATISVMGFGVAWNLLGDGISDAFDPNSVTKTYKLQFKHQKKIGKVSVEPSSITPLLKERLEPDPVLIFARSAVLHQDWDHALHSYRYLIYRNRKLDQVICDLALLARESPNESQYWQMLGDALSQNGEIIAASYAYRKIEKEVNLSHPK